MGGRRFETFLRGASLAVCALACMSITSPARAENDEIEIRLKTAGVDPPLRKRIHAAISRAVTYLLEQQSESGVIRGPHPRYGRHDVAYTTLAGLALAHSGGADARTGADRAIDWLINDKGETRAAAMTQSYQVGMLGMLLKARMRHPEVAQQIVTQIARGMDRKTAFWGYRVGSGESGSPAFVGMADRPNLSTAQFAALGLWAASKAGGTSPRGVWRAHMEAMLRLQSESGTWGYGARAGGWNATPNVYPTGACMGMANLILARGALEEELPYDPALAARIEIAMRRGMDALDIAARTILDGAAPNSALSFYYYGMYAMEKACVFAEVDELNGLKWYVTGAQQLIALQHESGAWGHGAVGSGRERFEPRGDPDVLATSFALLFLLRTSEVYRPTTPRGVPTPAAAVTGTRRVPERQENESVAEVEPPSHVTITAASTQVDRLWRLLKDDQTKPRHLVAAIEEISHTQSVLAPDRELDSPTPEQEAETEAAIAALRERIERALLKAFGQFEGPGHDAGEPIAVAAAVGLAAARPAAVVGLRKQLTSDLRGQAARFPSMPRLFAAMRTIAVVEHDGHLRWLGTFITTKSDPRSVRLSRAALSALGSLRHAPGRDRFRAVRTLLKQLGPLEIRAAERADDDLRSLTIRLHWRALAAPALFAVTALARDPATGDEPTLTTGLPPMSIAEYAKWFEQHDGAHDAPWRDAD
jgi:hypothetical protein